MQLFQVLKNPWQSTKVHLPHQGIALGLLVPLLVSHLFHFPLRFLYSPALSFLEDYCLSQIPPFPSVSLEPNVSFLGANGVSKGTDLSSVFNAFSIEDIARQLTYDDWLLFKRIEFRELQDTCWTKPNSATASPNGLFSSALSSFFPDLVLIILFSECLGGKV